MLDRTDVSVKVKRAPDAIATKAEAFDAFKRAVRYADMARGANMIAHRSDPGTGPFYRHMAREDAYLDAAAEWEAVLTAWFEKQ